MKDVAETRGVQRNIFSGAPTRNMNINHHVDWVLDTIFQDLRHATLLRKQPTVSVLD